jgi:hypothetical protein
MLRQNFRAELPNVPRKETCRSTRCDAEFFRQLRQQDHQPATTRQRFVLSNDWPRIESPSIWRALVAEDFFYFSALGEDSFSPLAQR